jgi:hypothetical protein
LRQLCDIGAVLETFADTLDWVRITGDAADRNYSAALALALGSAVAIVDAPLPAEVLAALASGSGPTVSAMVQRRVLRDPAWTALEQLTARQPSVLHLLPPNPARWLPSHAATRPASGLADGYRSWFLAAASIARRPGELSTERRFASELEALVFPRGIPDGSTSRRPLRRRVQARLGTS